MPTSRSNSSRYSNRPWWTRGSSRWRLSSVSCVPALAWLELAGVPIDAQRWRDRATYETNQAHALEAQLGALLAQSRNGSGHLFPEAMNWQSPQQVLDLLQHRGHAITKTDSETLAALAGVEPLIPVLLDYREAVKRAGTYGLAWLDKAVHPLTGRVHADYLQLGSRAGRMSCTKPNIQNLPRTQRRIAAVSPPSPAPASSRRTTRRSSSGLPP